MVRPAGIVAVLVGVLLTVASSAAANVLQVTRTDDPTPNGCHKHNCSLREAVIKANAHAGPDKIALGPKTYKLTIGGISEDAAAIGDLDILKNLRIVGVKPSKTVIRSDWTGNPNRLFQIFDGVNASMSGLTLRGGFASNVHLGAAVSVEFGGTLKLTRSRVTSAESMFGAIDNNGVARIKRSVFSHNHATSCCPAGFNEPGATATFTDVTFDRNTAANDTGAFYNYGTATLKNVTFSHNRAGNCCGGAAIARSGTLNLTNVTFFGNSTDGVGGALYVQSPAVVNANNVTMTKNTADRDADGSGDGGGLYRAGGTVNIRNSILAGNVDTGGQAPDCAQDAGDAFTSLGHNSIGPGPTGCTFTLGPGDRVGVEALVGLAPLADNGGFTKTVALRKSSDALNNGSHANPGSGGGACAKRDQRGVKRPQGPHCDIGAYERKPTHH